MVTINRVGQLWKTRTDFNLMYHKSGINRLQKYAYYVIINSKTTRFDNYSSTLHTIAITAPTGKVLIQSIVENKKKLEGRFEFMGDYVKEI